MFFFLSFDFGSIYLPLFRMWFSDGLRHPTAGGLSAWPRFIGHIHFTRNAAKLDIANYSPRYGRSFITPGSGEQAVYRVQSSGHRSRPWRL
jgi:hypothetical protein